MIGAADEIVVASDLEMKVAEVDTGRGTVARTCHLHAATSGAHDLVEL